MGLRECKRWPSTGNGARSDGDGLAGAGAYLGSKARRAFEAGRDPIAERAAANGAGWRDIMTFGRFASELIDGIEGGFRSEKHRKQWRSTLAIHASRLTDMPIDEFSTDDILKVLQPVWLKIPETASRTRSRIERILDAAKALDYRYGENPARWRGYLEFILAKLVRQEGVAAQALHLRF